MNLQTLENIHHHGCGIANTASGRHSACFRKLLRKPANKIYMHCFWDWKVFGESISEACGRVVIKAGGGTEAILQKWVPRKTRCGQVPYQNLICLPKWRGILRIFKQQPGPHLPRTQAPTHIHTLNSTRGLGLIAFSCQEQCVGQIDLQVAARSPARSAAGNESNTRLLQMPLSQRRWRERRPRCNLLPAATFFQCGDILSIYPVAL